ncbi:TOBE domain-containing protein [Methylocystis sp. 9N]|uniref:TOBE domain-containing protein n=1 Tax=Methylocystis borbori TaxID=3118750 RepID=A0ABU7XI72_9HYPH
MSEEKIDALVALRSKGKFLVGRDRIKILEAVAEYGSISKAAKAVGFSYKGAWDAVNSINNLLPSPAFVTKAGGRSGGGAEVTAEGLRLIAMFHQLEARVSRISSIIAEEGFEGNEDFLLWSVGVKISARNVFQAEVVEVKKWPVDVEVTLRLSSEHNICSIVTNDAAADLGLAPGRKVLALIKSSFVDLAPADADASSERNRFIGLVTRRVDAERNSEFLLDIGGGKTMTAVIPRQKAEKLKIAEGMRAAAVFEAQNVILAAD